MGTAVLSGRGRGVVVATGLDTEVGRIAVLVDQAQSGPAPLQQGLERLGRTLSLAVVAVTTSDHPPGALGPGRSCALVGGIPYAGCSN